MKSNFLIIFIFSLVFTGCFPVNQLYQKPPDINLFYDRVVIDYAIRNPELLSYARIVESYGFHYHNAWLTDASDQFTADNIARFKRDLHILHSYKKRNQTSSQKISSEILEWYLQNQVGMEPYIYYNYPLNQLEGVQNELPNFMVTIHAIENERDAKNYIRRLAKFSKKLDQVHQNLKVREELNIIPPDFVMKKVLTDMNEFIGKVPGENILYVNLNKKLNEVEGLTETEKENLLKHAEEKIRKNVYPSYEKLIAYFEELLPKADSKAGVWKFENGDEFYAYMLRNHTTTNLTPEKVHQIGLQEVDRILNEIKVILNDLGYDPKVGVGEHLREMANNPQFLYSNDEQGRQLCMDDYTNYITEAKSKMALAFNEGISEELIVKRIPKFKEETASGAYYEPPSYSGNRPGVFFINLRDMTTIPKYTMKTLAYHEAIPGHHFQVSHQLNMKKMPLFRKVIPFTAYVEGWALYAEKLAWEMGLVKDPYDNIGRLQAELFRAIRLVVDTGIHYKRWTREEAIEYIMANTGMAKSNAISEVERYIVDPGQACAYKIGELKILELRDKTKAALKEDFNLKEFHQVILENGGMPLEVLEKLVDNYIISKKGTHVLEQLKTQSSLLD